MGAALARVVLGPAWADRLPPASRNLFAYMAVCARDADRPARYYGGRDALVKSVYGQLAADDAERAGQYRWISKLLRPIRDAGGIELVNVPHTGARAEYVLNVWARVAESATQSEPESAVEGGQIGPDRVDKSATQPPRKGGQIGSKRVAKSGHESMAKKATPRKITTEEQTEEGKALASPDVSSLPKTTSSYDSSPVAESQQTVHKADLSPSADDLEFQRLKAQAKADHDRRERERKRRRREAEAHQRKIWSDAKRKCRHCYQTEGNCLTDEDGNRHNFEPWTDDQLSANRQFGERLRRQGGRS